MFDYKRWISDYCAYEFLFCDLFEIRKPEFGEKFLEESEIAFMHW